MRIVAALASMFFVLAGCASSIVEPTSECGLDSSWSHVVDLAETHIITIGEIHGTDEVPALVESLVCEFHEKGIPLRLGVEAPDSQSAELNDVTRAPFTKNEIYAAAPWTWDSLDGRSSQAMLRLITSVAKRRQAGADLEVFAFDISVESSKSGNSRSEVMAANIDQASAEFGGSVLVLAGGLHTRLKSVDGSRVADSMASLISTRPVVSLDMRHDGGEAFVIISVDGGERVTGPYEFSAGADVRPAIGTVEIEPLGPHYTGAFNVGPITASPPAFPADSAP